MNGDIMGINLIIQEILNKKKPSEGILGRLMLMIKPLL